MKGTNIIKMRFKTNVSKQTSKFSGQKIVGSGERAPARRALSTVLQRAVSAVALHRFISVFATLAVFVRTLERANPLNISILFKSLKLVYLKTSPVYHKNTSANCPVDDVLSLSFSFLELCFRGDPHLQNGRSNIDLIM